MHDKELDIDYVLWGLSEMIDNLNDEDLIERLYILKHEILDLKFGGNYGIFIQKLKK